MRTHSIDAATGKCIWCGSTYAGTGCMVSTLAHEWLDKQNLVLGFERVVALRAFAAGYSAAQHDAPQTLVG